MKVLLLDTSAVSILFKPGHPLHAKCFDVTRGNEWIISFMTRAELLLWPRVNNWGPSRRAELDRHIDLCTTLLPDENTCLHWADIMAESRSVGRPMTAADAWIAAAARQWGLALVTADYLDFAHLDGLNLVPLRP